MRPRDYDINLDYGPGVELRFVIEPNQIDARLPDFLECRHETLEEARETALWAASLVGHGVEIEAVAFWGWHGREVIDTILVKPEQKHCTNDMTITK